MRVYELAREMGLPSAALIAAAKAAVPPLDLDHASDAVTPGEATALRALLAPDASAEPDTVGVTPSVGPAPTPLRTAPYVLVRKASVGGTLRGERLDAAAWAALPEWAQAYFDRVASDRAD